VIKFSKCIKLFYNKLLTIPDQGSQSVEESLIFLFQKYLDSGDPKTGSYQGCDFNTTMNFEKKHFIILIEEPKNVDSFYLTKTIYQNFECIKHDYLHFTFSRSAIPNNFVEFPTAKLEKAYTACYPLLMKLKTRNSYDSLIGLKMLEEAKEERQESSPTLASKKDVEPPSLEPVRTPSPEPVKKMKISETDSPMPTLPKTAILVNRNPQEYTIPNSQQSTMQDQNQNNLSSLEMTLANLLGNQMNFTSPLNSMQYRSPLTNPFHNHQNLLLNTSLNSTVNNPLNNQFNNTQFNNTINNSYTNTNNNPYNNALLNSLNFNSMNSPLSQFLGNSVSSNSLQNPNSVYLMLLKVLASQTNNIS